jgi:hypothetical protein
LVRSLEFGETEIVLLEREGGDAASSGVDEEGE